MENTQKWTNDLTEKYKDNVETLRSYFEEAYKFLKEIEKINSNGFHLGTAVNMHFYYKEHFLFYFKFHPNANLPGIPVKFSPDFNLRLKHVAPISSPDLFFKPLLEKLNNSGLLSKNKIELIPRRNKSGNESYMLYVYSGDLSKIFFDFCREVVAEIGGNKFEMMRIHCPR